MRLAGLAVALALALAAAAPATLAQRGPPPEPPIADIARSELPPEAIATLGLIAKNGPFPYAKDGAVFANREGHLPKQKRGYYHEYTVKTPGSRTRGARRIIKGGGGEFFYTGDHYNTFRRILD